VRAVDAGVLACAVNRFVPEHARASAVIEELANGPAAWAIPWPAAHEFVRIVTHPHAVVKPLASADAWGYLERLRESASLRMLGPTERHGETVAEILRGPDAEGAGASELGRIELAAILWEHGVRELLSADRGMRRFRFLSVRDPLHGAEWSPREIPARRYRAPLTRTSDRLVPPPVPVARTR
jgi:predicted nucleic acid-binding protein